MKRNITTALFFILLIAACATSTDTEEVETTVEQDIEQEATVDDMLKKDQERIDSMEQVLRAQMDD